MLNKITKIFVYLTVFLVPIFFWPVTSSPLVWNKHILLVCLALLALIFWLANVIKVGRLSLKRDGLLTSIFILLVVLGISTLFSGSRTASFWSVMTAQSYLSFILYIIIFFLAGQVFDKSKDISRALWLLIASATILNLLFLIQLFFGSIWPWDFSQLAGFNLFGSVWALALFLGGMVIILMGFLTGPEPNKYYRYGGYAALALFLVSLVIIDYWLVWLGIVIGMLIIIWQKLKSHSVLEGKARVNLRSVYLPALLLVLAVVLIGIKLPLTKHYQLPSQLSLSTRATANIAQDSFNQSFKNMTIGSGPATYGYQFSLYRSENVIASDYWQVQFWQGKYALVDFLVEFGAFGLVGFLLIIFFFLQQGIRRVIVAKNKDSLEVTIFAVGLYFLLLWFFYLSNLALLFISFLMLGLWRAVINREIKDKKEIVFTKSPQQAFFIMLLAIVLMAGCLIVLYHGGKKYLAAVQFGEAIRTIRLEQDINSGIEPLNRAIDLDAQNGLYLRELSEIYLVQFIGLYNNQELDEGEKTAQLEPLIALLEALAPSLLEANSADSKNWEQVGKIYENLAVLNIELRQSAISSYLKANELDPKNPEILFRLGRQYFELAKNVYGQLPELNVSQEEEDQLIADYKQGFSDALAYFTKTINLKNNYVSAYYLRAIVHDVLAEYNLALTDYQVVLLFEPANQGVQERVETIQEMLED